MRLEAISAANLLTARTHENSIPKYYDWLEYSKPESKIFLIHCQDEWERFRLQKPPVSEVPSYKFAGAGGRGTREVGDDPEIVERKVCVFRPDQHGSRSLGGRGTLKAIGGMMEMKTGFLHCADSTLVTKCES
jgi:hypothetical protein